MKTNPVKYSAELVAVECGNQFAYVLWDLNKNGYYICAKLGTNAKFTADPAEALWFETTSGVALLQAEQLGYTKVTLRNKTVEITHACFIKPAAFVKTSLRYIIEDAARPGHYVSKKALNRSSEMLTTNEKNARLFLLSDQARECAKEQYRYASATLRKQ